MTRRTGRDSISSGAGAGGSKSKPRKACAPKAKSKTKKVPQEKKDEAEKANAVVLGNARKTIRLLDPVAKEAKKACKDVTARMISRRRRKGF